MVKVKWKVLLIVVFLIVALFLFLSQKQPNKAEVLKEVGRLSELNQQRNLSTIDFAHLRELTSRNQAAQRELAEAEFFALHGERKHVDHSLPQVYSAFANATYLCPLDDLAHASVYLRYGEVQLANKSMQEARDTYSTWLEKVERIKMRFPSTYPKLEEAKEKAEVIFSAENLQSAREELRYMEENGFC